MNNEKGFKNLFAKKEAVDIRATDSDDYTVVKNGRVDMILRILSLLCAIVIWISIVIGDSATKEFSNFTVSEKGSSTLRRTYDIDYDFTQVNFTIKGKGTEISQITKGDIQVYVDLSSVPTNLTDSASPQVFDLPLIYEIKIKGTNIVFQDKSRESIKVTFTKNK